MNIAIFLFYFSIQPSERPCNYIWNSERSEPSTQNSRNQKIVYSDSEIPSSIKQVVSEHLKSKLSKEIIENMFFWYVRIDYGSSWTSKSEQGNTQRQSVPLEYKIGFLYLMSNGLVVSASLSVNSQEKVTSAITLPDYFEDKAKYQLISLADAFIIAQERGFIFNSATIYDCYYTVHYSTDSGSIEIVFTETEDSEADWVPSGMHYEALEQKLHIPLDNPEHLYWRHCTIAYN